MLAVVGEGMAIGARRVCLIETGEQIGQCGFGRALANENEIILDLGDLRGSPALTELNRC